MPSFRTGVVGVVVAERPGLQRVAVVLDGDADGAEDRAYVLTGLTGPVESGDRVVVNTTAVELGLGTGGWHVVHWNLARDAWHHPGPGHIMKMRYTSLQADTGGAEEHHHDVPRSLDTTPVVVCGLHSQVGVVAATIGAIRPGTRVSYVMTDGAALPLVLSDLVASLVEAGLLAGTVTAGHAFGGDLEAVTVPSALTLARHVQRADVIVVGMGPGVVGTGSPLGTTATEVAPVLDAVDSLGGVGIICPRWSDADERPRHRGLSHHTVTALELVRSDVLVPVPAGAERHRGLADRHRQVEVEVPDVAALLRRAGLHVTTMGRGPDDDPGFFDHAAAAAVVAASRLGPPTGPPR
ncbi:MAG: DUF3866 family protein [Acidimicrobiales bacterium]